MKKWVLLFLVFLSACTIMSRKGEIAQWPAEINRLQGEGDLDLRWSEEKLSGSFALNMRYPDILLLEVYGSPFGQTIVHLEKDGDKFLLIAGNEKTTDEALLAERYAFGVRQLMDGLAMRGERKETPEGGFFIQYEDYRVVYGRNRRGRPTDCWERGKAKLCLTLTDISFGEP
jgi:hypothetical protein